MSSQRVVHNVANQIDTCEKLPCFASLSLNERSVTKGTLPRTQSIEAKRDQDGNIIPNTYTEDKHKENLQTMEKLNRDSLWYNFYDENVHPEDRKKGEGVKWPPDFPHFLRDEWTGKCPESLEKALDFPEMNAWVDGQSQAIKDAYENAKRDASKDNLLKLWNAMHFKTLFNLPIPPGFLRYTYVRKLEFGKQLGDKPKYFETKYFGPQWKEWNDATKANAKSCDVQEAKSPREAWDKFLGIYIQDPCKQGKKNKKDCAQGQQPAEQTQNDQPQQPSGGNGEQDDANGMVDGFFLSQPPASPPPKTDQLLPELGELGPPPPQDEPPKLSIPPPPNGPAPVIEDEDIMNLLNDLPQP